MTEEELAERRKQYYAARTPEQRQAWLAGVAATVTANFPLAGCKV